MFNIKMLDRMLWMGAGLGAGMLIKKHEKDITSFMKKERNKMMKVGSAMTNSTKSPSKK